MSSHQHEMTVNASLENVWKFVRSIDNWAPLVPGYLEHEMLNETESTWKFKSDLGIVKKKIHLKVNITQWIELDKVSFNLTGINEKISGQGYFKAIKLTNKQTKMIGFLDITAGGTLAKVVNPLLKTSIPEFTEELTSAVGKKIVDLEGIRD
ncbi:CoxG family protein [Bacillus benzoevorans]|uniref:Carbon monoxide dehydrogenase subunit G n=1 Tax=Bacillus benzoevorans TaxID=1456 RepID=A0A7X0HQS4_9BACI|nr:SRPBCC family protein [Bacillus benzoevorans]MBB6445223.1 carbon monoxide dehydrogenase subunit G [Bacillus benzoevorans]